MGDVNAPQMIPGLDWVKIQSDTANAYTETNLERLKRKCKSNPLVPIGALATVGALSYGLVTFVQGKKHMQQYMMRARVGAQLFTIIAASGGALISLMQSQFK